MDDIAIYGCIALLTAFVILSFVVVLRNSARLKRVEAKAGPASVSLDFYAEVKKEVARVSAITQADMARLDIQMIDFWESESLRQPEKGAARLELLRIEILRLESLFDQSSDDDRYRIASQLRELYREHLRHAREYWASGDGYQQVRQQVVAGLMKIERLSVAANESLSAHNARIGNA